MTEQARAESSSEVRTLAIADLEAVRALWARTEGLGNTPGDDVASLARFLARNPGLSQVALARGEAVGALLCGHDGRRGFLYRLAVHPAHRRHGLARSMVERALAGLRAEGIERCLAFVLDSNAGAARFWTGIGAERHADLAVFSLRP